MRVLTGAYNHSVDAKNRIRIPSKLKAGILNEKEEDVEQEDESRKRFTLIFHLGTDGCIQVYTQEVVDKLFEKYTAVKQSDFGNYKAVRQYLGMFEAVDSDPQGRMVIPTRFRNHAKIKKDIVICGMLDHIEIWAKEVYDEYMNFDEMDVKAVNDLYTVLDNI